MVIVVLVVRLSLTFSLRKNHDYPLWTRRQRNLVLTFCLLALGLIPGGSVLIFEMGE